MYHDMIGQMKKQLGQLNKWMDAAAEFARSKSFESSTILSVQLAPDQYAFLRQVQSTGDAAKLLASLLSGREAPSYPDSEKTLEDLQARVSAVVAYLDGFSPSDFDGAAERLVTRPHWEGKVMTGAEYFLQGGVPNFFFHLTHSYAILRHLGVPLGKRDYLGALPMRAR